MAKIISKTIDYINSEIWVHFYEGIRMLKKEKKIIYIFTFILIVIIFYFVIDKWHFETKNNEKHENTKIKGDNYIFVIYSRPMEVNTTVYVNDELVINLTNKTFFYFPAVSNIVKLENLNEFYIEVYERNLNLSLSKRIIMNENSYISVFISKEEISIDMKKELPDFE